MIFSLLFGNNDDLAPRNPLASRLKESTLRARLAESLTYYPTLTGALALVDVPGEIDWLAAANSQVSEQTISTLSPFSLGQLSEAIWATVALQLVEEGLLELDAPLSGWLDIHLLNLLTDGEGQQLSIRHLLNHSSGIFSQENGLELKPTQLLQWVLENGEAYDKPGQGYYPSTINYLLLQMVLEQASGKALARLLTAQIFEPLGMRDSALRQKSGMDIVSTAADLRRFVHALSAGFLFQDALSLAKMLSCDEAGFGLGLRIYSNGPGLGWTWGAAGNSGSNYCCFLYVEAYDAIIVYAGQRLSATTTDEPTYFVEQVLRDLAGDGKSHPTVS